MSILFFKYFIYLQQQGFLLNISSYIVFFLQFKYYVSIKTEEFVIYSNYFWGVLKFPFAVFSVKTPDGMYFSQNTLCIKFAWVIVNTRFIWLYDCTIWQCSAKDLHEHQQWIIITVIHRNILYKLYIISKHGVSLCNSLVRSIDGKKHRKIKKKPNGRQENIFKFEFRICNSQHLY